MPCRLALFDFDGTLADSFPFFASTFNELADRHGFRRIDAEEQPALRHRSPRELMAHVGMPRWKLPFVAKGFIALMRQNQRRVRLFEGIDEVLAQLYAGGIKLAIVSSNAEDNVREILGPDVAGRFACFECGMSIFGKSARIRKTLRELRCAPVDALYVGDQTTDLLASREAGVAFGAVSWGYGAIESMRAFHPDVEFHSVTDLSDLLQA